MDEISKIYLEKINPVLADRVRQLEALLGFEIHVNQGLRNSDEQRAHFAQGRMRLPTVNHLRKKVGLAPSTADENSTTVTDSPAFHSWHEYGLAVSVVPMGSVPNWNESHEMWKKIVDVARESNLLYGVSSNGELHLQPRELPISPTPLFISILQTKGIKDTWIHAGLTRETNV